MEAAYLSSPEEALRNFDVAEEKGLSDLQVQKATAQYGRNGTVQQHEISQEETY